MTNQPNRQSNVAAHLGLNRPGAQAETMRTMSRQK